MLKNFIFIVLVPLRVLGAVSETDVSGSDIDSPRNTPVASRRVSKHPEPRSPGERRQRAASDAILSLKVTDEDNFILQNFLAIPDPLLEKFTGGISLFAGNLRRLTKKRYNEGLESLVSELGNIFLRFQERPRILESIVHESASQFSQKLDLKITGASSSGTVSRKVKQEVISTEFFPTLLAGATKSILDRDQTILGITPESWVGTFANAYKETSRVHVLEVSGTVSVEDRPWYEHMTAVTPNPDANFFKLLTECSDRSRAWVRRMIKLYSSDRLPLSSLKMTKYFLAIPEEWQASIEKILETFSSEDFEKAKDSQARMIHLFMQKPVGPQMNLPHFVDIIGLLGKKFKGDLAEIFMRELGNSGWPHVVSEIRESKDRPGFDLTDSQLSFLFREASMQVQSSTVL